MRRLLTLLLIFLLLVGSAGWAKCAAFWAGVAGEAAYDALKDAMGEGPDTPAPDGVEGPGGDAGGGDGGSAPEMPGTPTITT